jgi:uncharacterized protein YdaU (DUF1376 family)
MSALPWFKCFPQDLLNGMAGMPADERGIYISVLCLIYRDGGPIRDDAREMAYNTGCTIKAWTKYRAALILHGKLYEVEHNGHRSLMNERCQAEIDAQKARCEKLSERASRGGKKKAENAKGKDNKNNGDGLAPAKIKQCLNVQDIDTELEQKGSVSNDTDAEASGEPPGLDGRAWTEAVRLLTRGGITEKQARSFFGKLLAGNHLQARDMLPALASAEVGETPDPQPYLTAAARAIGGRRIGAKPKRVAFV